MCDFNEYLKRHGEIGVQAIVECLERYEGLSISSACSLEERWHSVMQRSTPYKSLAA